MKKRNILSVIYNRDTTFMLKKYSLMGVTMLFYTLSACAMQPNKKQTEQHFSLKTINNLLAKELDKYDRAQETYTNSDKKTFIITRKEQRIPATLDWSDQLNTILTRIAKAPKINPYELKHTLQLLDATRKTAYFEWMNDSMFLWNVMQFDHKYTVLQGRYRKEMHAIQRLHEEKHKKMTQSHKKMLVHRARTSTTTKTTQRPVTALPHFHDYKKDKKNPTQVHLGQKKSYIQINLAKKAHDC